MPPVQLAIIGAGSRGSGFARYARQHPDEARVVGVAEPRDPYRNALAAAHSLPPENVFRDWQEAASRPRFADAVIIATQDRMHVGPAVAFAALGYAVLLEKPMAPDEPGCRRIVEAVKQHHTLFAVGHVMRYTAYTQTLKRMIDAGQIGDIVSIQLLEQVGFWHYAHAFVRGNWRNEALSSPMLLSKSCHDLDWIHYLIGAPCEKVSSFGTLKHFRAEDRPPQAADRCLDCPVEPSCPYSAKRIYLERIRAGHTGWPVSILTPDVTEPAVIEALRTGPYGRCVYACDNDVVDNQVVNMQFEGNRTAAFTLAAFTPMGDRLARIFGTCGALYGDGRTIEHFDFLHNRREVIDTHASEGSILGGHGGGDERLMRAFVSAVAANDPTPVLTGPDETLASHLIVFAAERARLENRVVTL